jgi:transcriptional regulator with XRE-family HTH domain
MVNIQDMGALIREKRWELGLTQRQLAALAGISRATIASLELGSLAEIGFVKLQRICESVGLEMRAAPVPVGRPTMDELIALNQEEHKQNHAKKPRFRS